MCAGVQNVSRPIVECQEMSQSKPIGRHATPHTASHPCQEMDDLEVAAIGGVLVEMTVVLSMRARASPNRAARQSAKRVAIANTLLVALPILIGWKNVLRLP